jgi:hypothetical protein
MTAQELGNQLAFPEVVTSNDFDRDQETFYANTYSHGGLTKREEFARTAMLGYLISGLPVTQLAQAAVNRADDLLHELARAR